MKYVVRCGPLPTRRPLQRLVSRMRSVGLQAPPLTWTRLRKEAKGRPIRVIRRFLLDQPNGKQRVIDDAAASGQSELSADCNRLQFCSALQQAMHLMTLWREWREARGDCAVDDEVVTGGEDWPDAFRHTPMHPSHAEGCIVAYWHAQREEPVFHIYRGMLFGLPLSR